MTLQAYAAATATDWDARARGAGWVLAPGSLMKVDLSGFTRLSERLAKADLAGAEHLNTVLNDVFVALIDEVLDRGGDVLQFGGDALLVWFEGPGHEVRAVTAGRAMQRRLAQRPAESTPAGPVRLRMSAGVATGDLLLCVVGEDHRELLTLGPVATRTEAMEKQAASGQLLMDAATARVLRANEVAVAAPGAWRSRAIPADVPVGRRTLAAFGAETFVPPDVRELKAAGQVTGEHRRSSVAFVGVGGLDGLLEREGAEAVVARVRRVAGAVDEAVVATRVTWTATDLMADGAVFLLFAGAPVAREDDEERLLRAARIVVERCQGDEVRVGAHAGRVFAADVGHPDRRTFAIIGDTTNLAARLMHRAQPGQVLVSDEVYESSERDHEVDWAEPFTVRNRRAPVRAGVLGARTAVTGRRTHDVPLVGRDAELSVLGDLVSAVRTGDGGTIRVALTGEPGVGKSRLVEATVQQADGLEVVRIAPTVFDASTPYAAMTGPLRQVLGLGLEPSGHDGVAVAALAVHAEEPGLLPLLNLPLGLDLPPTAASRDVDPQFLEARRNSVLAQLLHDRPAPPLLAVVEDLHWLDRASAGLVDMLARRAEPGRIGLLVTARGDLAAHLATAQTWTSLPLAALGAEEARRLAIELSGQAALSDADLHRLVADTGGNPLFLRELISFGATGGELPASAEEVISARIDSMGPGPRRLLRDVSVGGPVQRLDDVSRVLGDSEPFNPDVWSRLADFVTVTESPAGPEVRFRHELYRQSAYQGLAVRRRRAVHGAWSDHLLALADHQGPDSAPSAVSPATLAVHLHEAERHGEAWRWARRAADLAREAGALQDAVPLYERALLAGRRAGVPDDALASACEALGDTAELVGLYDTAGSALQRAARVGEPVDVTRRLVKRATALERQAKYRTALALLTRAQRVVDGSTGTAEVGGGADVVQVRAALALRRSSVHHRLGRLRRAYDLAAQVAATSGSGSASVEGLRVERARALLRLEMIASEAGRPERFDLGREALTAFEGLDEDRDLAMLLGNIGVTLWESDDWTGARRRYEESMEVYRRAGDVLGAAIAANNVGEILCEQGDLVGAYEVFEDARRAFRAAGHAWGVGCTASALGRVAARTGDVRRATALLDEAVAGLDAIGSTIFAADARVRQVELALVTERDDALAVAADMVQRLSKMEVGAVLPLTAARYHALAIAGTGEPEGARALATGALERAVDAGVVHEESLLLDLLVSLAAIRGEAADPGWVSRRDDTWARLGIREVFRYPQVCSGLP